MMDVREGQIFHYLNSINSELCFDRHSGSLGDCEKLIPYDLIGAAGVLTNLIVNDSKCSFIFFLSNAVFDSCITASVYAILTKYRNITQISRNN